MKGVHNSPTGFEHLSTANKHILGGNKLSEANIADKIYKSNI